MKWKLPPRIKIYEALGCIADGRIEIEDNQARVLSSSGGKSYSVKYDPEKNAIMSNDNGSYWAGYLGYPSIAFLMAKGVLRYDPQCAEALKGIRWKDINVKFKNNFEKTESYVIGLLIERGFDEGRVKSEIDSIFGQIEKLNIEKLGPRMRPPGGY
jgi:hypothetical protein